MEELRMEIWFCSTLWDRPQTSCTLGRDLIFWVCRDQNSLICMRCLDVCHGTWNGSSKLNKMKSLMFHIPNWFWGCTDEIQVQSIWSFEWLFIKPRILNCIFDSFSIPLIWLNGDAIVWLGANTPNLYHYFDGKT